MTNKQKLMFGSLVGIVALLGIILLLFIRQSQGQPHTSPAPQIDTNKVVKRINGELFTDAGFGTYLADPDNYAGSTYVDGQDLGSQNINDAVAKSLESEEQGTSFSKLFEKGQIVNLKITWETDGNAFIARGDLVRRDTGKMYPFAFEFNTKYQILQECFEANIKI